MIPLYPHRFLRLAAVLVLAGGLSACIGVAPETTTGTIGGAGVADRTQVRDEVVCEFDPLYRRDVCYRN